MIKLYSFLIAVVVIGLTGVDAYAQESTLQGTIDIGALVPVTGDASSHGDDIRITISLAEEDFNKYLEDNGYEWRLNVVAEDTGSNPVIALDKITTLYAKDINAIVGTYSSSELRNVKGYAENNNMLLISYGSTAPSLALPDDNVYRFVPDETRQAPAIAKYFESAGITNIVPIWRNDAWGNGFIDAIRTEVAKVGGVVDDGITYNPEAIEFATEVSLLNEQVEKHVSEVGADKVAVVVITFSEITPIAQSASQYDALSQVLWFSTDTVVNDVELINDRIAQDFFTETGLIITAFSLPSNQLSDDINERASAINGRNPNTYAMTAYDVVWGLGLAILESDSTDTNAIKAALPKVLENYSGAVGTIVLNEAGDKAHAIYKIYDVVRDDWTLLGTYDSSTDVLVFADDDKELMMMKESTLQGTIDIGALVPVTGDASSHGDDIRITISLAEEDFNKYLEDNGYEWRLNVVAEDTGSNPVIALDKITTLYAKDINAIVGTYSSSELRNVKGYAENNNMLLISYGSTAPSLALPDDNVYRFVPDETRQAPAIAKYFESAGITNIVPIWRNDAWGNGFIDAIRTEVAKVGGVVDDGITYNPEAIEFATEVSLLNEQVEKHVSEVGADKVAVVVITFSEITPIAQSASQYDALSQVLWFSTDTVVNDVELINDRIAQDFFTETGLIITAFSLPSNQLSDDINERASAINGRNPNTYAMTAYDVVWGLGLAILESDSTDTNAIKAALPKVLENYSGAVGTIVLNEAGDKAHAIYKIYDVVRDDWTLLGTYDSSTDVLVFADDDKELMMMKESTLQGTIDIGALVPVTGDASSHGDDIRITISLAEEDFNKYLEDNGYEWRLNVVAEDTGSNPVIALDKITTLYAKDINAIVGTYSSSELRNVKGYAENNNMLLISYGSTAPSLALPDDNVYRFVPDETRQAPAIAKYFESAGITNIVPIWRNDAWGNGFIDAIRTEVAKVGGVVDDGITYNPEAIEFATEVSLLNEQVEKHVSEVGADKVAVVVITFSEITPIAQSASQYDALSQVLWFSTDTVVNDVELINDRIAQDFFTETGLIITAFSLPSNQLSDDINERASAINGRNPNTYAMTAYDVVWGLGLAILESDSTDTNAIKAALPKVLENYSGAVGTIVLNEAGDKAHAIYKIYDVVRDDWTLLGTYDSSTDVLVFADDDDDTMTDVDDDTMTDVDDTAMTDDKSSVTSTGDDGGCLIATAAYGSELSSQVQLLREIRNDSLLSTGVGTSFMDGFNQVYYSFSPAIADLQRENMVFKDVVRTVITPGIYALNIMTFAEPGSEISILAFGLISIAMVVGIYLIVPVIAIYAVGKKIKQYV